MSNIIEINKSISNINIKLQAIYAGEDLCVLITGGEKPHIGAVCVYSKDEGMQTISLKTHKDYIISEMFINSVKDIVVGNISVSCGIHIDNITKEQIKIIANISNDIFTEMKDKITNNI